MTSPPGPVPESEPEPAPRPETGYAYLDDVQADAVVAMAHRGGAGHPDMIGLENTLEAFAHAVEMGYRYLETDIHATSDGVLIAFHDDSLDRVTDRSGRIADLSAAEVARARVGGTHRIPTLEDLLTAFPTVRFNIDIKAPTAVTPLADLIERTDVVDRVLIGSFSAASMRAFRRAAPAGVPTSATPVEVAAFLQPSVRLTRLATRGRPAALQVPHRRGPIPVVTAGFIRRAHAAGLHVHVWTVDEPTEMHELLDLGVDGLISDRTDVLKGVLQERGQWGDN